MNINKKTSKRTCTSCQMCAAVCGKNAISIELDEDGFYRPIVDESVCVGCGLCTNVCYKFEDPIDVYGKDKLATTLLYGASAKDRDVLSKTTSGGVADLLAHQLIEEGYKCVGVVYDSEIDKPVDRIASTENEIIGFRGSKYVQSYTLDAFKQIVNTCKTEKYAIFGTPCHIFALDKYLRLRNVREDNILIDLFCHGCPSMNIWKKYVKDIKQLTKQPKIDNVNFRSKVRGWGNFCVALEANGKTVHYSSNSHNEFFDLFFCDQVLNEACNDCKLRGTLEYTDIRLGDFWGKQYALNDNGVSAVSLVSDRAKKLFGKISEKIDYREEQYENFLNWQSWGKEHHPNKGLRNVLLEQLRDDNVTLCESIKTIYRQQSFKCKLVRHAKQIVHAMPLSWGKCIRWLFYRL